jgi:hemerythrin-like metal-binding protein
MFIEWSSAIDVNVEKFNTQHKGLVDLVNALHDAMVKGKGKEVLESTLSNLVDYTKNHFQDEETAMEKYAYPSLLQHRLEHRKLTDQVLAFQKKYQSGEKYISIEILNFLKNWLINHIMGTDKKYGVYFQEKGIIIS